MNLRLWLGLTLALTSIKGFAVTVPLSQGYDSRIQVAKYNPSDVMLIKTTAGRATLIQLEEGETILSSELSGMGMGDAQAWGMDIRGNNIFLKPTAENPDTNLLVVSDKGRTYSFDLITTSRLLKTSYLVKFSYEKKRPKSEYKEKRVPCGNGPFDFNYLKWGNSHIAPNYVWNDGRFTCLKFNNVVEQPVIYQKGFGGEEMLVNSHIEKDTVVVHGVPQELRLRLGEAVLGLYGTDVKSQGYNHKGTTLDSNRLVNDYD